LSCLLFVGALLLTHEIYSLTNPYDIASSAVEVKSALKLLFPFLMLVLGVYALWQEVLGIDNMIDGYEDMRWTMSQALNHLTRPSNQCEEVLDEVTKKVIVDVAKEAIVEHLRWSEVQRKNDIRNR
jgi:hypothetical protein